MQNFFDTVIIGGGPAGVAAAVYAARKKMKTLFIAVQIGGQSIVSSKIGNWIGEPELSGFELAQKLEKHLRVQEAIEIRVPEKAEKIEKADGGFKVATDKGEYLTKTIIVCTGGRDRRLGVPGEEKFSGKGVAYCSTCDAPFFKDKKVVVVGSGNAGLEAVIDLTAYAKEILLFEVGSKISGDPKTFEKIKKNEKVKVFLQTKIKEIKGENAVSSIVYKETTEQQQKEKQIQVDGVFVEVGVASNSVIVKDLVNLNEKKEIIIANPCTGETSQEGIYSAGDVSDEKYKQNNIAVGDAIKAVLSVYDYLKNEKKE
jgi:alkyl hydroperoxide reductase subunit F